MTRPYYNFSTKAELDDALQLWFRQMFFCRDCFGDLDKPALCKYHQHQRDAIKRAASALDYRQEQKEEQREAEKGA